MGIVTLQQAINWILGAVIGSAIAFVWQRRGWLFQQNLKRAIDKYEAQVALTREGFSLVDKRIFASRLYLDSLIGGEQKSITEERERYRKVVEEWNEKASGIVILIRVRFGASYAIAFEQYFLPAFSELDRKLRQRRTAVDKGGFDLSLLTRGIRDDLALINVQARESMLEMVRQTSETLRVVDESPLIVMKNISNLSYFYLFKSLFKPRQQS
ncbi:hypothetical protein NKH55_03700 [Mesorhizobium opportunistum]|uniref:hypothetical protein n=1 Tax=Mesorhizobium opportunistum TaxID=593909 RepID=UPI00333C5347